MPTSPMTSSSVPPALLVPPPAALPIPTQRRGTPTRRTPPSRRRRRDGNAAREKDAEMSGATAPEESQKRTSSSPQRTLLTPSTIALRDVALEDSATPQSPPFPARLIEHIESLEMLSASQGLGAIGSTYSELRRIYADVISKHPLVAVEKNIDQRLWISWEDEFGGLESLLSQARGREQSTDARAESIATAESKLVNAMYAALDSYRVLIDDVKTVAVWEDPTFPLLLHRLSLAHAHVLYLLEHHNPLEKKSWFMPELYYETARRWAPSRGETHYHLARVVLHDGRRAEAMYHFVRNALSEVPYGGPSLLAELFLQIFRAAPTVVEATATGEGAAWDAFNASVVSHVAWFFAQNHMGSQDPDTSTLAHSLAVLVDALCQDAGQHPIQRLVMRTIQLVRVVGLLIACAKLPSDPASSQMRENRALGLIVTMTACLLHRCVAAATNPFVSHSSRREALQLLLPPLNVALSWLRTQPRSAMTALEMWSDIVSLCLTCHSALINGHFYEPSRLAETRLLLPQEDIEIAAFGPLQSSTSVASSSRPIPLQVEAQQLSSDELFRLRAQRFVALAESLRPAPETSSTDSAEESPQFSPGDADERNRLNALTVNSPTPSAGDTSAPVRVETIALAPRQRVVVLDAANIAMRHGQRQRFSARGIQLCASFFSGRGDRVVAFLPDYYT
ncbi:hypothetical protein P43SY_007527 [Pythium insidiosum]|uniref:Telomerase-binding protein EST1A n=1 Tax=Pythium insidiosum TaxID=114742 RepID=A0AAD5M0Z2_PYTIN|nr:hypothetical protein P43SY_007527 [Pythium insidiosum]